MNIKFKQEGSGCEIDISALPADERQQLTRLIARSDLITNSGSDYEVVFSPNAGKTFVVRWGKDAVPDKSKDLVKYLKGESAVIRWHKG